MIDWKARIKNKAFWVSIISTAVLLAQQLGYDIFPSNWLDITNSILTLGILLGIVVDNSTEGISDK